MIIIIICAVIGMVIAYRRMSRSYYGFEWVDSILVGLVGLVSGLIGLLIAAALPVHYAVDTKQFPIVTVEDSPNIGGRFYINSGYVKGGIGYAFYVQTDENEYELVNTTSGQTKVKYTTGRPLATLNVKYADNCILNYFAFDADIDDHYTYILEVPKGTINNSFSLDAR